MLKSKYFWIAMLIFIPFLIIWITEGFGWAIFTLIAFAVIVFGILLAMKSPRRTRRYYYDGRENQDFIIRSKSLKSSQSSLDRGISLHVPKINKKGAEFISGSNNLRKIQEDNMKRTKKNLWG
jgi:hypothetical protein